MENNFVKKDNSGCAFPLIPSMIILDGISALFIGFMYFLHIQMTDYFSDYQTIGVMMEQQASFAVWSAFGYLVISIISVIYGRRKSKPFGIIVFACLAVLHTIGVMLLRITNGQFLLVDFLKPIVYISLLYNLLLLFLIFITNRSTTMKMG